MDELTIQLIAKMKQGILRYGGVESFFQVVKKTKVPRKLMAGKKLLLKLLRSRIHNQKKGTVQYEKS